MGSIGRGICHLRSDEVDFQRKTVTYVLVLVQ